MAENPENPQQQEIPVTPVKILRVSEGNFGPWPNIGKTLAFKNRLREAENKHNLYETGVPFDIYPQQTTPGHEDVEAEIIEINTNLSLFMSREQLEEARDADNFDKRFKLLYGIVNPELKALSVGASNAGRDPIHSYPEARRKIEKLSEKVLQKYFLGKGTFRGEGDIPELWRKWPDYKNPFVVDVIPLNKPMPKERKIITTQETNLDMLFCPYWTGSLYKKSQVKEELDNFIEQTGSRFFGVASTMWDLRLIEKNGIPQKHLSFRANLADKWKDEYSLLIEEPADLGALTSDINQSRMRMIDRPRREVYEEIEKDIKNHLYGGERALTELVQQKARELYENGSREEVENEMKKLYQINSDIRKHLLDILNSEQEVAWEKSMVQDIEETYKNFGYLAGWPEANMNFEIEERRGILNPKLYYLGEELKTSPVPEQKNGTYGVIFMVPNKLIDSENPMQAGLKLKNGVVGYVANVLPVIGGEAIPQSAYEEILSMVGAGKAFENPNI